MTADLQSLLTADSPDLAAIAAETGHTLYYVIGWRRGWLDRLDDVCLAAIGGPAMGAMVADYATGTQDGRAARAKHDLAEMGAARMVRCAGGCGDEYPSDHLRQGCCARCWARVPRPAWLKGDA